MKLHLTQELVVLLILASSIAACPASPPFPASLPGGLIRVACPPGYSGDGYERYCQNDDKWASEVKTDCELDSYSESNCNDGIMNGPETDIDCGGGICSPCRLLDNCIDHFDCATLYCLSNKCMTRVVVTPSSNVHLLDNDVWPVTDPLSYEISHWLDAALYKCRVEFLAATKSSNNRFESAENNPTFVIPASTFVVGETVLLQTDYYCHLKYIPARVKPFLPSLWTAENITNAVFYGAGANPQIHIISQLPNPTISTAITTVLTSARWTLRIIVNPALPGARYSFAYQCFYLPDPNAIACPAVDPAAPNHLNFVEDFWLSGLYRIGITMTRIDDGVRLFYIASVIVVDPGVFQPTLTVNLQTLTSKVAAFDLDQILRLSGDLNFFGMFTMDDIDRIAWQVVTADTPIDVVYSETILKQHNQILLFLDPSDNNLQPNTVYTFTAVIRMKSMITIRGSLSVFIFKPDGFDILIFCPPQTQDITTYSAEPSGGSCIPTPEVAQPYETEVNIVCRNWVSSYGALTYEFGAMLGQDVLKLRKPQSSTQFQTTLPRTCTQIYVKIFDKYSKYTLVLIPITMINSVESPECYAKTFTSSLLSLIEVQQVCNRVTTDGDTPANRLTMQLDILYLLSLVKDLSFSVSTTSHLYIFSADWCWDSSRARLEVRNFLVTHLLQVVYEIGQSLLLHNLGSTTILHSLVSSLLETTQLAQTLKRKQMKECSDTASSLLVMLVELTSRMPLLPKEQESILLPVAEVLTRLLNHHEKCEVITDLSRHWNLLLRLRIFGTLVGEKALIVNETNVEAFSLHIALSGEETILPFSQAQIILPPNILCPNAPTDVGDLTCVHFSDVKDCFMETHHFDEKDVKEQVNSGLFDITFTNSNTTNITLSDYFCKNFTFFIPLHISHPNRPGGKCHDSGSTLGDRRYYCSWLDPLTKEWSSEGCSTSPAMDKTNKSTLGFYCSCSHMTSFAILSRSMNDCLEQVGNSVHLVWAIAHAMFLPYVVYSLTVLCLKPVSRTNNKIPLSIHWLVLLFLLVKTSTSVAIYKSLDLSYGVQVFAYFVPQMLMFWIFSMMVYSWSSILHRICVMEVSVEDSSKVKIVLICVNVFLSLAVLTLYLLLPNQSIRKYVFWAGSCTLALIRCVVACFFLFYGRGVYVAIMKSLQMLKEPDTKGSRVEAIATRVLDISIIFCFCLIVQSLLLVYMAFKSSITRHLLELTDVVYASMDIVMCIAILFVFAQMVKDTRSEISFQRFSNLNSRNTPRDSKGRSGGGLSPSGRSGLTVTDVL